MNVPARNNLKLRILLMIELFLFALPTLMVLAQFILFLTLFSFGSLIAVLYSILTFSDNVNTEHLIFATITSGVSIATFVALFHFATLSVSYIEGENTHTKKYRAKFWIGLLTSIVPLSFATIAAISESTLGIQHWLRLIYMSGLPILIPVFHLAFATNLRD